MGRTTTNYQKNVSVIYQVNSFLGSINDLDRLLHLIMEEAGKAVNAEASSIALYDSRKKELFFTVALGKKGKKVKEIRVKIGQGIIGYAAKTKKPLNIPDVSKDSRFNTGIDNKTGFKSTSILAVPLLHKNKLIGALEVLNKKGAKHFSAQDEELLEIIAGQAAISIENAILYQKLSKKHQALKKKHKQLIEAQQKIIFMERLSTVGRMASGIIHDIRNPLSVIKCGADFLAKAGRSEEEREKFAKIICSEADRLTDMTNELLEYTRGESSSLQIVETSLGDLIQETCFAIERDFKSKNINIITELNYTDSVQVDISKIQRVIFNLASNAKDAMAEGGSFKITTNLINNKVEIKLSDTGKGISLEISKNLFEPFVTHGKSHGTGLGLAIVKKIIECHKGKIKVERTSPPPAKDNYATTFTITLPL